MNAAMLHPDVPGLRSTAMNAVVGALLCDDAHTELDNGGRGMLIEKLADMKVRQRQNVS